MPASNYQPEGTAARLRAAVARIDRLLARDVLGSGLTRTEFSVLGAVVRRGGQRLGDLADREGVNPTMLSRVAAGLEKAGLVQRAADPDDGRAVLVTPTDDGARLYARLQAERSAHIEDHLAGLDAASRAALDAALPVLEGLAEALQERRAPAGAAR